MSATQPSKCPSHGTVVRTLRDGYWDRTELIRLNDGCLRVRKSSKGAQAPGPWSVHSLRREMQYLMALQGPAADYFPALLAAWDHAQRPGYEMAYIANTTDLGTIGCSAGMQQRQVDLFQDKLGQVMFNLIHEQVRPQYSLAQHISEVIDSVLRQLQQQNELAPLINAQSVWINGDRLAGTQAAMQRLVRDGHALRSIDQPPHVRLHGDFFLENILLGPQTVDPQWPGQLTLIDPVSVAGVFQGHPLFDLVKYESYATGELPALRSEKIELEGFNDPAQGRYIYRFCTEDPAIRPFRQIDWHSRLRSAYLSKYGLIDQAAYYLLEAYFAAVMTICTTGRQRPARLLKATLALNAALQD